MASDRPAFVSGDRLGGSDAEVRSAIEGYQAYFGRYTVDTQKGTVTHIIEVWFIDVWCSEAHHF